MSRSKHAVELCALLVDETYGELTSRIFTILLRRGRLPITLLAQHTRLSPRQLRHGLVVLLQQNLLFYHTDTDSGVTHYEANHDAAYALIRSGKILNIVEERFGEQSRDVVQNLLLLGHTKVADLTAAYEAQKPTSNGHSNGHSATNGVSYTNGDHVNGVHDSQVHSTGQLHAILHQLLEAGFIEPVNQIMFTSPTDLYNKVEKELLPAGGTKGIKQKEELRLAIEGRMQALRDQRPDWRPKGNNKRPHNGDGPNGTIKRRRLSNGAVNGNSQYLDESIRLDSELVLRINYEKCNVALRSQSLVSLANQRIGETTSYVYAEVLRLIEPYIPRCRIESEKDSNLFEKANVSTAELSAVISSSVNVALGIGKASKDKIDTKMLEQASGRKRKANEAEVDSDGDASSDESESDEEMVGAGDGEDPFADGQKRKPGQAKVTFQDKPEDRQSRMLQLRNHLMLLAADDRNLLSKCGGGGQGQWTVDFNTLVKHLREIELDNLILENFGRQGHRLARILRKFGKLDEKQLPQHALMKQKDVRTKMVEMQMAGFVDIQEVPRDNNRATSRTIFLWFFDMDRVTAIVLDNIYKAMSRCLQRLEVEKRQANDIITAAERSDVRGKEEEVLSANQMNQLREIRGKEEKLLAQVARLDDLIGIFRDF
ncbi:hypothetical protein BP6252_07966 [Coleophoma cylindrospora]|uniref:DNA-directed RNA polymerase III subunit RPC3 n=1 Tax=Coleophoma cylindrospora TaxID=1849047 RepID=A0A3D8RBG7_9HELO|nr:hypothetical protein BP6252_07966 [Coleophoma cylindrospora]